MAGRGAAGYAASHFAVFPDVALALSSAFVAGDWAAAEWTHGGTYTGSLPGLPPGAGQPFSIRGTAVFELEGDRIRRGASDFDFYGLLIQFGLLPAPGAATPAP
ncbi:MAG: ester cyclase [Chloroflexota bacterium]|nr:ester cyclase [Chloroflexota bacterium]